MANDMSKVEHLIYSSLQAIVCLGNTPLPQSLPCLTRLYRNVIPTQLGATMMTCFNLALELLTISLFFNNCSRLEILSRALCNSLWSCIVRAINPHLVSLLAFIDSIAETRRAERSWLRAWIDLAIASQVAFSAASKSLFNSAIKLALSTACALSSCRSSSQR